MLERYFERKLRESGRYTRIGRYWDRKGENEIDLIAVNESEGSFSFCIWEKLFPMVKLVSKEIEEEGCASSRY